MDCPRPGVVDDELRARTERAADGEGENGRRTSSWRPSPAGRPSFSPGLAPPASAVHPPEKNACNIFEGVFGGALGTSPVSPIQDPLSAVVTNRLPAAKVESPSEDYFVAYGHCLLAGAGTGVYDEAAEAAAAYHPSGVMGQLPGGDFGGASGRARVSEKRRVCRYGDALEVFQEGLRRYPACTTLLYGASFTMQVWMNALVESSWGGALFRAKEPKRTLPGCPVLAASHRAVECHQPRPGQALTAMDWASCSLSQP